MQTKNPVASVYDGNKQTKQKKTNERVEGNGAMKREQI